jgi:hypothetical protein
MGFGALAVGLGHDHIRPAHEILSFLECSKAGIMKESLWCSWNNSMLGLEKISPEDYKPRNLALVPCIKEKCPEWNRYDSNCIHLTRVKKQF